ncbi:ELMO domain-containing protein A [Dorcoceras hygrometricum]|uniref:ELMO domain-containing protein A n=1 Tax=Dorcoceras hygrometricum TaxID=472368 RepID=A0A2Z7BA08_9LAMI|nr:ELMO domain-containing protein A [Dorcoceras hygrometricum]
MADEPVFPFTDERDKIMVKKNYNPFPGGIRVPDRRGTPELDWSKISSWNSKGTLKLIQQFTSRVQGTQSWFTSLEQEQHEDQAQNVEVQNGSSADKVQCTRAVIECEAVYKSKLINSVLADGLDEVSEWIKRTSKHTMALDEKNRADLIYQPAGRKPAGNRAKLVDKLRASKKLKRRKEQNKLCCRQKEAQMQNCSRTD